MQIPNLLKIRPVGAELFYADGQADKQTGMMKLIVAFRNYANAPKIQFPVDNLKTAWQGPNVQSIHKSQKDFRKT